MIFVTVGTQKHFDRLVRTVDEWAALCGRTDIFAQIGSSNYRPKHISSSSFIDPTEFRKRVASASIVIAHAGIGVIITALELEKRLIVMPRRADLGEHRNNHQLATAKRLFEQSRIIVAFNEGELIQKLNRLQLTSGTTGFIEEPSPLLIGAIRSFIEEANVYD